MNNQFSLKFIQLESIAGMLLMLTAILALIFANTDLNRIYDLLLSSHFYVGVEEYRLSKPILLWINDGLMALFFFLIGLEVKREFLEGQLADKSQVMLPAVGAVGGIVAPVLVFYFFNRSSPETIHGWAIPAATDIAFAVGVLSLFHRKVPYSLKLFLLSLAIFDDLVAIIIIALFYTEGISVQALLFASIFMMALLIVNRLKITHLPLYMVLGLLLWFSVLKSGVHATLAGVVVAFLIPMRSKNPNYSPVEYCETKLHLWVTFLILPIFAFANAGMVLDATAFKNMLNPLSLGIFFGLFLGKQLGIFGFVWLAIKLKFAQLPEGATWRKLYGVSALCGIGFTMSFFISSLAFQHTGMDYSSMSRLSILLGSMASAILGAVLLGFSQDYKKPVIDEKRMHEQH